MRFHKNRIINIVEEILNYLFSIGVSDIHMDIIDKETKYEIIFTCNIKDVDISKIDVLSEKLNCEKVEEIEEYYWGLTGESQFDNQLSLVGMMVDDFEIKTVKDNLNLKLYRNKN